MGDVCSFVHTWIARPRVMLWPWNPMEPKKAVRAGAEGRHGVRRAGVSRFVGSSEDHREVWAGRDDLRAGGQVVGTLTGNDKLKAEGQVDETVGNVEAAVGRASRKTGNAITSVGKAVKG
jgi:uncharacterized protein YjbJ (UPF0337 family)